MSNQKNNLPEMPKTKKEQLIDSVLGCEEEMDDELAALILAEYGIDEAGFVDNFRQVLQEDLRKIPPMSNEADNLRAAIKSISNYQKASNPENAEPDSYFADLLSNIKNTFRKPAYSFRNRENSELPDEDKEILDELEKELDDEVDNGGN